MKHTYLKFTGKRFAGMHRMGNAAYKTDATTAAELKAAKEARELEIKTAEEAYKAFEIKSPADFQKSLELMKTVFELKGAEELKNYEEKMEALEAASTEAKAATDKNYLELKAAHDSLQGGFDALQIRIKNDNRTGTAKPVEQKTFNENLADAIKDNFEEIKAHNKKGAPELKIEMKAVGDMNMAANFPGSTPWTQDVRNPLILRPENRVWLADLLPQGTTNGTSILYPKENGGEGGVAPWTDRTANKAQMDFDLTTQTAYVKWLAGWVEVDRDMLDDLAWFTSYLQSKMLISLKTAENDFILNGTSDTNPVQGLLDLATAYDGSYTAAVDRLIDAGWGQIVEDTFDFYNPTTIILTPRDAVAVGLNKAGGTGEYNLPNGSTAFADGRLIVGGLTVAPTTQIGTGNFLVFDRNATSFVKKMQPELRMFEDAVLAKKNRVMFRIEERATLVVFNNNAIVSGELSGS